MLIYHVHCFVSAPNALKNIPEGPCCVVFASSNVPFTKSEGQFCFEPVTPYQSTVVFAVLVGQVSNGGCNAGIEELLPLVKVALMDFIEELMVSAHIDIRRDKLTEARNRRKKKMNGKAKPASLLWRNANTHSGIFSARCSICSISDWKKIE